MDVIDHSTRKSLPLSPRDLQDLATLKGSPLHRAVLGDLAGSVVSESSSDAAVLHAVWEAGLKAVMERVEEAGYAQMRSERDLSARQAVARRRAPGWADES